MMIQNGDHLAHLLKEGGFDPKDKDRASWPWESFDCTDWAEAMVKRGKELGHDLDLDWVRSWMAAALMRGYDEGRSIEAAKRPKADFYGRPVESSGL